MSRASRPKRLRYFATPTIYHKAAAGSRSYHSDRSADVWIACFVIAQRPRHGGRYAAAGAYPHARRTPRAALRDPEIVVVSHVQTLQRSIDRQCGAQATGAATQVT